MTAGNTALWNQVREFQAKLKDCEDKIVRLRKEGSLVSPNPTPGSLKSLELYISPRSFYRCKPWSRSENKKKQGKQRIFVGPDTFTLEHPLKLDNDCKREGSCVRFFFSQTVRVCQLPQLSYVLKSSFVSIKSFKCFILALPSSLKRIVAVLNVQIVQM